MIPPLTKRPTQWIVRQWFVDPNGLDPDEEMDTDVLDAGTAAREVARLAKLGKLVGVVERVNIRPDGIGGWDYEERVIEGDE